MAARTKSADVSFHDLTINLDPIRVWDYVSQGDYQPLLEVLPNQIRMGS